MIVCTIIGMVIGSFIGFGVGFVFNEKLDNLDDYDKRDDSDSPKKHSKDRRRIMKEFIYTVLIFLFLYFSCWFAYICGVPF